MTATALGIDVGSTTCKVVGVDATGELVWSYLEASDPRMEAQAARLIERARAETGAAGAPVVATGYGRGLVKAADKAVTEITCHARGAFRAAGHGGTLVDIGGQDSKVILIAPSGRVGAFQMNDKCAAGTGRFLEVQAGRLRFDLPGFSEAALSTTDEVDISSTCTIFAESEVISLIANGQPVEQIVRGLHRSLVKRVAAMARMVGVTPPVMISGGVANSAAIRALLGEELGVAVELPAHPQLMGAYGAALTARKLAD